MLQGEAPALPDDAFLEFKHYARLPLAGERIYRFVTVAGDSQVLRKQTTRQRIEAALGGDESNDGTPVYEETRNALPAEPANAAEAEAAFVGGGDVPEGTGESEGVTSSDVGDDSGSAEGDESEGGALNRMLGPAADKRNAEIENE